MEHDAAVITAEEAERVVGWAFSEHLATGAPLPPPPAAAAAEKLDLSAASFQAAFGIHQALKVRPPPYPALNP